MEFFVNEQSSSNTQSLTEKAVTRMAWEKPYLEALIDHLNPSGEVLEVGFALGYSSNRIQTFHPKHHVIIESDPEIAAKALKWAEHNPAITVIHDTWKNALPNLGIFDAVFFNDIDPELEAQKTRNLNTGNMVIKKGQALISRIKEQIPQIASTKYTDSDLDVFFNQVGQFQPSQMANFLHDLMKNEQISKECYERLLAKHNLQKTAPPTTTSTEKHTDVMLLFLQDCLQNHMRKGSRFSCFASSPISKFENPEFFDAIITSPNYDYQERMMPVDVPTSCEYYKHDEALIMLVEKQDRGND